MKYDCIVIGAGIGGLTCAARFAKNGMKILLCEKFEHIGGTASVFRREGYTFAAGPLSFSYPVYVASTLKELGVKEEITFKRSHFQYKSGKIDLLLSLPFQELTDELKKYFPEEKKGIRSFFRLMKKIGKAQDKRWEWDYQLLEGNKKNEAKKPYGNEVEKRLSVIKKYSRVGANKLADGFVKDEILENLLANQSFEEGTMSASLAANMWDLMSETGIWYPDIGFEGIGKLFSKIISENGGEIRTFSPVSKIVVRNGKATGVELSGGEEIKSDIVISCLDHKLTFLQMIGESFLPHDFVKWVRDLRDSGSVFCVYLGVDSSKVDLSALRALHLFYRSSIAPVDLWGSGTFSKEFFTRREFEICHWSGKDKSFAPERKDAIIIRVNAPYEHFRKWKAMEGGRKEGYYEYKDKIIKYLIQAAETILPGLSSSVEFSEASTPLTYETWGGGSEGACAGWSWDESDEMGSELKCLIRTPVPNLYMVGYQAFSQLFMGGFATAMHSGNMVADMIVEEVNG
ncbi:MAG: hypothetical protein A3C43_07995 [Candidatus Schekmanbacteria bacterium RIFCSPHIGHO2_02_FULL_38_11]|uniref:Amine oxidase domain-containing protein n=1 Tax=Candidatus Schekmanbacteria bacterium RIFCSPLOWO2_12_FULL_38_15 TaxID=1817883 RepID=A0A1F7SL44_9BACT|nr:MAG: hypothetical protein A3C43_07995 [Candidatus Schekmanbacteria bacterium RIFCSPHIGHO2_02_FULL_38_11]OGL54506.1 MAG: hypothetical protein A3G31_10125 [Candidatus Schekmanbacteria bacterium RIFCSPLOWO2_12_FULL_38_15]